MIRLLIGIFLFILIIYLTINYILNQDVEYIDLSDGHKIDNTQNIDNGWWHNDDVKKRSKSGAVRSTSVGDRMKINGDIYMVDLAGFRKINNL